MAKGHDRADYLLYVDHLAVGVPRGEAGGHVAVGVEWQSAMYGEGLPPDARLKAVTEDGRLPFVVEASGSRPLRWTLPRVIVWWRGCPVVVGGGRLLVGNAHGSCCGRGVLAGHRVGAHGL